MARLLASNQATGVRLPDPALEVMVDASLAERSGRASQVRQAGSTPAGRSRESANGRLPDFESGGGGSNPPSRTPGQLLLVVTPRSERGGRWFDSSPRNSSSSPHGSHPAGSGACLENRWRPEGRLWVRVPRLPPRRPGYANGRAARLKPGCLWVRLPPRVLGRWVQRFRLGRQWADHSRLEREMLRVRVPPEPSITPSWSSPECSPPCHGGGRGFESRRGRWSERDGTVRKPAKRPGSNPGILWVRLPPVLLADE